MGMTSQYTVTVLIFEITYILMAGSIIAVNSKKLNGQIQVGSGVGTTLQKAFEIVIDVAAKVTGQRVTINSAVPPETCPIEFKLYGRFN